MPFRLLAGGLLFLYHFTRKKVPEVEGYDNDIILLLLDDDLFWIPEDENVAILQSEPAAVVSRRLHGQSDMRSDKRELG